MKEWREAGKVGGRLRKKDEGRKMNAKRKEDTGRRIQEGGYRKVKEGRKEGR